MKTYIYPLIYAIAMAATIYYNGLNHPIAKIVSMAAFGSLLLFSFINRVKTKGKNKIFSSCFVWYILACVINFVYGTMKGIEYNNIVFYFNLEIAQPLIVAYSSYYLFDIKREKLSIYMLPICLFAAYCSISSVLSGLGGFVVSEYYDDEIAKNQVGIAFASIAIICAVFALESKRIIRVTYAILSVICLYPVIFFACRTALISYGVVVAFLLYRDYKWKGIIVAPLLLGIIVLLGGDSLNDILYSSIVGRKDVNDFDDLTSGRVTHATLSLEYFLRNPLVGFYGSSDGFNHMPPNAHIYLLYRLTKWGIIGAIPFIALYWSLLKVFIRSVKKQDLLIAGLLCLAFIASFSEFAPPFGPGSSFIIMYILIGYYLRQETLKV